jgi:hypothetical protein
MARNYCMSAETLNAEYYRRQAHLCHKLAESAQAAKPLFSRLHLLAQAYTAKANAADSIPACEPSTESASSAQVEFGNAPIS